MEYKHISLLDTTRERENPKHAEGKVFFFFALKIKKKRQNLEPWWREGLRGFRTARTYP
jgi:hypothetical protein